MFKVLLCIAMKHDWALVGVAAVVCLASSWATFFLYAKAPVFDRWRRLGWLAMTGLVAGSGIWTTHFVGMLAFQTGLPTGYIAVPTLGSLAIAIVGAGFGFAIAWDGSATSSHAPRVLAGGLIVGASITAMHYVGMLGYSTAGRLLWDNAYVVASVTIGAVLGAAALATARHGADTRRQIAAAAMLSLGIVGMHFTGMTAVTIIPDPRLPVAADLLSAPMMAAIAVGVTALILVTALAGVAFDATSRYGSLRRLREALDAMPDGIAFFGPDDRLVAWNAKYADLCESCGATAIAGLPFTEMLRRGLEIAAFPEAVGRESEWLQHRQALRAKGADNLLQRTVDGRWLRVTERRTADGGVVSSCVDITELKRTEAAMAEARDTAEEQARRADVAEAIAGLGHWRLDARTQEITWSDQLCRIYGFEPGARLDFGAAMAMTHPDDAAAANERIARQLTGGGQESTPTRIVRADGMVRYLTGFTRAEHDAEGQIVAVVGSLTDISDQKTAELALAASEERFRRLAVNAPSIIAECRLDGVMTYISPASLALTGFAPEELIGRTFASMMEPEDAEAVRSMCQTVLASKGKVAPWTVEFRALHRSGARIWLACKPTPVTDASGKVTGLTDVIVDITERKALEVQLRAAQAEAEAAAAVKGEFLANMSHELRTPLTSIIGFTSLASEQIELSKLTRTYIERVTDASQALLCTVNDILDFSKLEAGQVSIHPQPVSLSKLARATLDLFTPQAGAKDIQLLLDDPSDPDLVLSIDPDRVRQILLNFVSNAVKFTASGGVTLRTAYDAVGQILSVDVVDTGGGIPEAKQALLFQRFSQIDGSLTRSAGGTGLGLAICKGLVEAMGGQIGVESHIGEGSRFWFRIPAPISALAAVADAGGRPARPEFEGVRVLVVDDHPTNRELARLFLAAVGAEVTEACDGEEAVELASSWPFDVILMDLRMPRLDGMGALRRIRSGPGPNDATPILAFTADASIELVESLTAQGFDDVVAKPLEPNALLAAIARATAIETAPTRGLAHAV